jgi:hypothetical protein
MMRRLGWLTDFAGEEYTVLEIVQNVEQVKVTCKKGPPGFSEAQPDFETYNALTNGDKEMFLRRKLREALEAFRVRLGA